MSTHTHIFSLSLSLSLCLLSHVGARAIQSSTSAEEAEQKSALTVSVTFSLLFLYPQGTPLPEAPRIKWYCK